MLAQNIPWFLGGSADLGPSNKTTLKYEGAGDFQADNPGGKNLHFGVREHAMAAVVNGLSLSKLRPFGATFFIFSDYARPAIRLVVAPHKVFGPETNDLVLQLRKRKIARVVLGGMLANMCVESHLRELIEQGFEVTVVKDATAAPKHPTWGYGYTAALINYAYLAHAVLRADEVVQSMKRGG